MLLRDNGNQFFSVQCYSLSRTQQRNLVLLLSLCGWIEAIHFAMHAIIVSVKKNFAKMTMNRYV